jgi:hypothetical protein
MVSAFTHFPVSETLDFSIGELAVLFLWIVLDDLSLMISPSFFFLKGLVLPAVLQKGLSNYRLYIFFFIMILWCHFVTDFFHVQIFGQNQSLSFYVQFFFCLPYNQSVIISHHFSYIFYICINL